MTKTTRVMLAVLAVCGTSAALAQSSVTLYGRVNTSIEHQKLGNASATGLVSNSSFIGFKGVEDLGNGLKAGFVLEAGFNSDDGSGNAGANSDQFNFSRNSEVNLAGSFGMLRLGSFDAASYLATADVVSMHNHDTGPTADALYQHIEKGGNTIAYSIPEIAGVNAEIQYRFGEKAGLPNSEDKGGWNLGLNYATGPLGLGFGYSSEKEKDNLTGFTNKFQQYALRASYEIGDLVLAGYYQKQNNKDAGVKEKRNVYRIAAKYTMGASEFHANVGQASKAKIDGVKTGKSATQWTLAYNYNLSKRTKVYALYSTVSHTDDAFITAPATFDLDPTKGDKFRTFGVGIRHLF